MKLSRLLLSAAPFLVFAVRAQEPPAPKVVRLGEFVVEGTAAERDVVKHPGLASPALDIASSSVERLQLELQGGATLSDALEFAPGIFTEKRGRKEKSFSSFRGQIYPYPDYALNGIWQREFHDFSSVFPAAAIERIEILRSSGALTIGPTSGLVGAINLIPRRFDEQTTVFDARYGTHNSALSSVVTGDTLEQGYYTVGANWWSTSGPSDENAAERMLSLFATGGLDLPDGLRLEAMAFYARGHRELRRAQDPAPGGLKAQIMQFSPNTYFGGTLRGILEHNDDASTELTLGYFRRDPVVERLDTAPPTSTDESDWEYTAGLVHARRLTEDNTLRIGAQWNQWVSPEGKRSYTGSPMDVHTFSGFVIDEQRLGNLTLDAGFRYTQSYFKKYTDRTFAITGQNLKAIPIEKEWDDPILTATFGAKYALNETAELFGHLAVGTVSAPPGATSLAGSSLDRETRGMIDAGVKLERPGWGMIKIGGFLVERRDAIVLTTDTFTVAGIDYHCHGNQDVRQYGLEIEGRSARMLEHFELFASATLMESRRKDGGWGKYKEIPGAILSAGIYGEFGPLDVNLFGKYVDGFENYRFAAGGQYQDLGDFFHLNLTAGYSFGQDRRTRLYVLLENLLDDKYSTVNSYPDYGFQASAGLRHIF